MRAGQVNDILANEDRQRLKDFIRRLSGSKDPGAMDRRGTSFSSIWSCKAFWKQNGLRRLGCRSSARVAWASARFSSSLGGCTSAAEKLSMRPASRRYRKAKGLRKVYFVDLICKAFDEALSAGNQGDIDPVHAASSMSAYEKTMRISKKECPFTTTRGSS